MPQTLKGQKALVTGSSSGIGRAVARAMAAAGASVVVNYFGSADDAEKLVREIENDGGTALAIQADVGKEEDVESMFSRMLEEFGTIDILVNNAGIQKDADLVDMELDQWTQVIQTNLTGQFLCTRAAIREFVRRGVVASVSKAAGKVICMSSVHEFIPWAGHSNYAASKGGLMMFMKSVAQEVGHLKIRVNSIAPGAIKTAINRGAWEDPDARADLLEKIPYGRIGEVEDIGRVAVWLASDDADYVHGVTITVDGGMNLYPSFIEGG